MSILSDKILTCFGCISGYLQLCSTGGEDAKGTNRGAYIMATGIGSTYTRDTYIGSTYAMSI